ncbi:cyclin-K-like [Liolophura sinensis]|uniref:cyclin-K-like n=1 Tax=Liolophura sinensis TaxID=3198878 RepID=UPI003158B31F
MPCWYYEKKELRNTPSFLDNIDPNTEARYRREGARFIFDAGTKLGLRYDSCATGVVYFHRFYMFHSFKEFHRYVTGACCLFLAGKVEETPKKCKDIIKTCRSLLTEQQFSVFGEDPREEVMTLERILLQTIKFDLQVQHPYTRLLHYAKQLKGDKQKIQKVVQMAWTFINDSMCTMLSLQWEPDIISVAMLYLATRLSKLDIQDWVGKPQGSKLKWWEGLVEDLSQELIEDICHQVLDLYSSKSQKREESPPMTPSQRPQPSAKRTRNSSPLDESLPSSQGKNSSGGKAPKLDNERGPSRSTSKEDLGRREPKRRVEAPQSSHAPSAPYSGPPSTYSGAPPATTQSVPTSHPSTAPATHPAGPPGSHQAYQGGDNGFTQYNPYVSSQMYSSSFMSQEGSQSIQSLITGGEGSNPNYTEPPPQQPHDYNQVYQPPPGYQPQPYTSNPPPPAQPYPPHTQSYPNYPPPPRSYPPPVPTSTQPQAPGYDPRLPFPGGSQSYQHPPPPAQPQQQQYNYNQQYGQANYPHHQTYQPPPGGQQFPQYNNPGGPPRGPHPKKPKKSDSSTPNKSTCLATVRITGR